MTPEEAYEHALNEVERNEDGSVDEKKLADLMAGLVDFDAEDAQRKIAKDYIARKKRPGKTAPYGAIMLPGMEKFAYEPRRLVADENGRVIENEFARPSFKAAEARRAQKNAMRVQIHASRKQQEASLYADWAMDQLGRGRKAEDITYGNFIRESGLWSDRDAPVEDAGDES